MFFEVHIFCHGNFQKTRLIYLRRHTLPRGGRPKPSHVSNEIVMTFKAILGCEQVLTIIITHHPTSSFST